MLAFLFYVWPLKTMFAIVKEVCIKIMCILCIVLFGLGRSAMFAMGVYRVCEFVFLTRF